MVVMSSLFKKFKNVIVYEPEVVFDNKLDYTFSNGKQLSYWTEHLFKKSIPSSVITKCVEAFCVYRFPFTTSVVGAP